PKTSPYVLNLETNGGDYRMQCKRALMSAPIAGSASDHDSKIVYPESKRDNVAIGSLRLDKSPILFGYFSKSGRYQISGPLGLPGASEKRRHVHQGPCTIVSWLLQRWRKQNPKWTRCLSWSD